MYKVSLTRVTLFTGNITGQCDVKLSIFLMYSGCTIILNNYVTHNMIQLIMNKKYKSPTRNDQGHS